METVESQPIINKISGDIIYREFSFGQIKSTFEEIKEAQGKEERVIKDLSQEFEKNVFRKRIKKYTKATKNVRKKKCKRKSKNPSIELSRLKKFLKSNYKKQIRKL